MRRRRLKRRSRRGGFPERSPGPTAFGSASQRGGSAPSLLRVPFNDIDEAVHILDAEPAPWSIQMEARVSGTLDEARLRAAVRDALARHPLARARKAPSRGWDRRLYWEIPPEVELDPLRVVRCPDDEALAAARAELYGLSVPLAESPPLRLRLVRHPQGDLVMLNVNHAACDGFATLRILRSIARAYAGERDPVPEAGLSATRDLRSALAARDAKARARRYRLLAEKLRDLAGAPARIASEEASERTGYGFHHVRLSREETEAVVFSKRGAATVNDTLLAALHLSIDQWNANHGVPTGRVGVVVPVNLRPRELREEMVANVALPVRVSTTPRERASPPIVLEAVTAQTQRIKKEEGSAAALIEVLGPVASLPYWAKQVLPALIPLSGSRLVDTAQLSNMGRVDETPSFGSEAGETTELWFSPPARFPLGLSLGAVTTRERLHLAFRYRHRLLGADAASRFAHVYLSALDLVTKQGFRLQGTGSRG